MSETLDCTGLACPEPVIKVKNFLKKTADKEVTVLVSSETARDNVLRIIKKMGWGKRIESISQGYKLILTKQS